MQDKAHSVISLRDYLDAKVTASVDVLTPLDETLKSDAGDNSDDMGINSKQGVEPITIQSEMWPVESLEKHSKETDENGPSPDMTNNEAEMIKLREQLYQTQLRLTELHDQDFQEPYSTVYHKLIASGLSKTHASVLIRRAEDKFQAQAGIKQNNVMKLIQLEFSKLLQDYQAYSKAARSGPRMITLIGGTGAGKTTSLMKIASNEILHTDQKVALVSLDRYRLGANSALDLFSKITSVPLYKPQSNSELATLKLELEQYDLVIIDTPGRNPDNQNYISEIKDFLTLFTPGDVFLTTNLNADAEDTYHNYSAYLSLNPTALIFTKLDETLRTGKMVSLAAKFGLPIAYVCDGQDATGNIHPPTSSMIWDKLIESIERN